MDELWQRYRTFWTPVLIGLGVFLVGVIVVHIMSEDPEAASLRMAEARNRVKRMKSPDPKKARMLKDRGAALREAVMGDSQAGRPGWAQRLDQTGGDAKDRIGAAAEQALRAAIVRGAPEDEAQRPARLKDRFGGDDVAADKAYKRFRALVEVHGEGLRTGDPNVAFSRLLSDVWSELRIRANRADVEISSQAEQLGFASIASVSRATLPSRVLNLALAARVVDVAIREGVDSIDQVEMKTQVDPSNPEDFLVLWPVDFAVTGDMNAVMHVIDMLTDPSNPIPLGTTRLAQPKRSGQSVGGGSVQLFVTASSLIVRPEVDLVLDAEEEE